MDKRTTWIILVALVIIFLPDLIFLVTPIPPPWMIYVMLTLVIVGIILLIYVVYIWWKEKHSEGEPQAR